jgi:alpha-1,6-mannosyltransferase
MAAMAVTCPYTKVEESFNMQAMSDWLHLGISRLDQVCAIVVMAKLMTRTLVGSFGISRGCTANIYWRNTSGVDRVASRRHAERGHSAYQISAANRRCVHITSSAHSVRIVLGSGWWVAWRRLRQSVTRVYGDSVGTAFIVITATQFHLLFYASRALPNTFAMIIGLRLDCRCGNLFSPVGNGALARNGRVKWRRYGAATKGTDVVSIHHDCRRYFPL